MNNELEILVSANLDQNKSIVAINKSIEKIEKKIQQLKLTAILDNGKSKAEIQKQIESLNKQRKKLYVDLQLRKDTLKKQYKELQKESNFTLNVNTTTAEKNIRNVSDTITGATNESVTFGLALKNALSNAGLVMSAQRALNLVRRAINEATKSIKEYDEYTKNLKIITNKDDVSDLIADYATKSINMKINISEYESASEVILRAGKNLAESTEYTESAIKLAKTGFIETDTAAENLITISNSYNLTADKLKNVTDTLLTLDVQTNTEAGALSSAMAKSAKNAQLAGLSYEQLGATIAKLRDTTGKTEAEIATSLNNIFNRTYRVKPNTFTFENENGETEDLSKPLSDVEKVVNQLGISIRKSSTEFKSFEEIISTIAPIWKDLDSVSQNAISSVFAGQHKNVFLNLVNDWQDIVELTKTAENSFNATETKYNAYLNSLEAKSAEFSTVAKEMWNHLIPEGFVGDLTEAGTATLKFVDDYKVLQTALKSAVFYGLAKGAIATKNSFAGMVTNVKNVSTAFVQLEAIQKSSLGTTEYANNINALGKTVGTLTDKQAKLVLSTKSLSNSQRIAILNAAGLEDAEAEQRLATLGLAQANETATASTFSLSGSMKTLFATLSANPVLLLTAAFTAFTAIQQTVQRNNEEMRESAVEAIDKYNEQSQALDDLRQKYIDICNSEDSTTSKTEELNRWKKTLIETYGLEKEAIEQVNLAREDGLKLIDDEIIKNQINGAETWLTDNRKAYEDAQKKLLGANNSAETSVIPKANVVMNIEKGALDDYSENFDDIIKQLTIKNPTKDNPLAQIKIQGSNVLQQYENLSKILNDITSIEVTKGLNKSEQELYDALLTKQAEYKKVVTDDMRDIVENGKKYTSMIQLYNFETDSGINFDNVSDDTYKEFRDKFLESLGYGYKKDSEDFSLDIEKILLNMLPDLENSYRGIEITDIVDTSNADEISEDINSVANAVDDLEKSFEKLSKSASSYVSNQKTLTSAYDEIKEHGQLSANAVQSLVEAGYAQALSIDEQTGKITINKSAVEKLNEQYREKIKLDSIQQKSELQEKFKEEQKAINDLATEMQYANQERREAIMLEMQQHGLALSDISEQMSQIDALSNSVYAPTFESKNKSSGTDTYKEKAEQEISDIKHLYEMEQITYEDYINQIDGINQKYFANNSKYLSEFYKYEEEVYKGRKKLAEDFYNEQKKYHENRVEELKSQITVTEDKSVDSSGNSLNPSEKFDYIRASYSDLIAENERRINEIMQSGIEGHEDEVKELERQIEEYADKLQDVFKDEIDYEIDYIETLQDKYDDFIDKRIDRYEDEKKAIEDKYDTEIKSIDDTINALKDKNDATSKAIELKKAEQDLENASQRTRMVYGADGTVSYRQDDEKIAEAQQKVDDLKLDMLVDSLEKQKEAKETEKDAALGKYDTMIADLEAQKKSQDEFFETVIDKLNNENNPQPTEGIDSVIDKTYDNPSEANEVKQGLKDVENAVNNGTEQAKENANEVKKADNNTSNSANKTDNKSQSASSKTATTANSNNNNAVKTDVKQSGNSVNTNTSETADKKSDASNKQVVVYGEQVAVYDNGGENKQTEQTSNYDSFMKLLYSMSGKEPDGYERWKRGEYDEGFKRMGNIFSDDAFMNRAKKPYEDAINSFNETVNKLNDIKLNQQPVNVTTGDIVIQNPVGNTKQLAQEIKNELQKEALMEIPNAAMKTIHSNLK